MAQHLSQIFSTIRLEPFSRLSASPGFWCLGIPAMLWDRRRTAQFRPWHTESCFFLFSFNFCCCWFIWDWFSGKQIKSNMGVTLAGVGSELYVWNLEYYFWAESVRGEERERRLFSFHFHSIFIPFFNPFLFHFHDLLQAQAVGSSKLCPGLAKSSTLILFFINSRRSAMLKYRQSQNHVFFIWFLKYLRSWMSWSHLTSRQQKPWNLCITPWLCIYNKFYIVEKFWSWFPPDVGKLVLFLFTLMWGCTRRAGPQEHIGDP